MAARRRADATASRGHRLELPVRRGPDGCGGADLEPGRADPRRRDAGFADGRGYGRAITIAGAAALHEMGSTSVRVCTPSANVGGVATYKAAGFVARPEIADRVRVSEGLADGVEDLVDPGSHGVE
ncbi:hypothetical protein Abr02nite_17790 [Paractinoplanes brasiliensis]|nr:hypothetical protein Abr02nite_17790 [Actinoplanes brasiliensis]